ncbi:methionyl-tRNA formyltransferase [Rhodophyticola porphyridii]|uniref:Methionyl-tRNA formyltransferase n=1 Tax=Rhodophyticola porphyridii TaxID=1852017 RepID=A0A3L9XZ79_9RHOB|nr:formyltransferase family protein [Rhodophyticola porphyridii]RMA41542.1 methionyl-tRNA formyltransferase [Rhodophyticola porphyridii]
MRTVFIGAVEGSAKALEALCRSGHAPSLVVTLPLELSYRHSDFADLEPICTAYALPIHRTPKSEAPDTLHLIAELQPDLLLVVGWSQLCSAALRNIPRIGSLGFHPSALPRLRGRAVIPWTILLGLKETAATLFWLEDGADTGPIASQRPIPVDPDRETAASLYEKQITALAEMLPPLVARIADGDVPADPQDDSLASICGRRRPENGLIDWSRPAAEIERLIRAVGPPYPGAFTYSESGTRLTLTLAEPHPRENYFIGLPGQVQAINGNHFTVSCGDSRSIDITAWEGAHEPPRVHTLLGEERK